MTVKQLIKQLKKYDENGEAIKFENMTKAKEFLAKNGYSEEHIEAEGIDFEECE